MKISKSMLKSFWLLLLALIIMIANGLPVWLVIVLTAVILIAPLIREFRKDTDLDERQIQISHFSSHLTFFVFLALTMFIMINEYYAKGLNPDSQWYMLLIVPVVVKMFISLFQNYGAVVTAKWIGYFFAGIWLIFVILSHGISLEGVIEAIPFILILVIAYFSRLFPRSAGIVFILLACAIIIFFKAWQNFDIYMRIMMHTLLPLPLLISGIALILYGNKKQKSVE
jgi:hypothetical protein